MLSEMTYHAFEQRKNRFAYITDTVGFGNPVASMPSKTDNTSIRTLTDTGVIIVTNRYTNKIVTAFIATTSQALTVYKTDKNGARLPNALMSKIRYNQDLIDLQPLN